MVQKNKQVKFSELSLKTRVGILEKIVFYGSATFILYLLINILIVNLLANENYLYLKLSLIGFLLLVLGFVFISAALNLSFIFLNQLELINLFWVDQIPKFKKISKFIKNNYQDIFLVLYIFIVATYHFIHFKGYELIVSLGGLMGLFYMRMSSKKLKQ